MIMDTAVKIHNTLGCRDISRIDFRLTDKNELYFIEINPLAGLNPRSSDLVIMAGLVGIKYNELIGSILGAAVKRYQM